MRVGIIIGTAGVLGGLAVVLGALGAHALTDLLSAKSLASFKTGVLYHLIHALFLLGLGAASKYFTEKQLKTIFNLTIVGIVLFSFSIYLLATKTIHGLEVSFLGPITPIGGLTLILAWFYMGFVGFKGVKQQNS